MAKTSSTKPGIFDIEDSVGNTVGRLLTYRKRADGTDADEVTTYTIVYARVDVRGTFYNFTVTRPTDNQINLELSDVDSLAIGVGRFPWSLVWEEPGDIIRTAHQGYLILRENF